METMQPALLGRYAEQRAPLGGGEVPVIGGFEECVEIFAQFGTLVCTGSPGNHCFAMSQPRASVMFHRAMEHSGSNPGGFC